MLGLCVHCVGFMLSELILLYVAFCTIMGISRQKEARRRDYAPLLFRMTLIVHSTIGSTVHSMPLNKLEHYICTPTITNIRPNRASNLAPPGYKPQSIQMSHRRRPGFKWKKERNSIDSIIQCTYWTNIQHIKITKDKTHFFNFKHLHTN